MGLGVFDDQTMMFINQTYQRADAFLFGRRTYEIFADSWGARSGLAPGRICGQSRSARR